MRGPGRLGNPIVSVELNHTIVMARDKRVSAEFMAEMLGLEVGAPFGPFLPVTTVNGVTLDFADSDRDEIVSQHYAFLVSEDDFDVIFQRIQRAGITYYADPARERQERSTAATAGAASTSWIPTDTSWRSSPARTAAAARTPGPGPSGRSVRREAARCRGHLPRRSRWPPGRGRPCWR